MSVTPWTVELWEPDGSGSWATVENGLLAGEPVIRTLDPAIVIPPGSSRLLNLFVRQSVLQIPPRAIIQLLIDGTPVFWGPAVIVPPPDSPGAGPFDRDRDALERVTVVGGEQLLRDSLVGARLFEENTDVATIAHELCELYAHPALTHEETDFPATGAVLSAFYTPEETLYNALQKLVNLTPGGAACWVDAEGHIHFQAHASE
jgi:hypothetical protein